MSSKDSPCGCEVNKTSDGFTVTSLEPDGSEVGNVYLLYESGERTCWVIGSVDKAHKLVLNAESQTRDEFVQAASDATARANAAGTTG